MQVNVAIESMDCNMKCNFVWSPLEQRVHLPRASQMEAATNEALDWDCLAKSMDTKSPLEIMDHVSILSFFFRNKCLCDALFPILLYYLLVVLVHIL